MSYTYIPNNYDNEFINKIGERSFENLQIKYRNGFEKILKEIIDFNEINKMINEFLSGIPTTDDYDYNFYHKDSFFENKYLFLRNNVYLEKLTSDELLYLQYEKELSKDFFDKTYEKVLFEGENDYFFGTQINDNLKNGNKIIFEFCYDMKKCESVEQIVGINDLCNKIFNYVKEKIKNLYSIEFVIYKQIPDIYKK